MGCGARPISVGPPRISASPSSPSARGGLIVQLFFLQPLVTRFGEGWVITGGLAVLAASMLLQPILREPYTAVALMGMLMMGHSLAFPTAGALTTRIAPVERQGSTWG